MSQPTITLYGTPLSGHAHRAEAFLNILGLPFRYVDSPAALRQSAEFLALNPLGQIPVLVDGEVVVPDSVAILTYLADRYDQSGRWNPKDTGIAAQVQRWLSIAAGDIRFGPAAARIITLFKTSSSLDDAQAVAVRILRFMDGHLESRAFLAADHATIADLACYAYVATAPEGHVSLEPYPALRRWLARVEALPGFTAMPRTPVPEPVPQPETV